MYYRNFEATKRMNISDACRHLKAFFFFNSPMKPPDKRILHSSVQYMTVYGTKYLCSVIISQSVQSLLQLLKIPQVFLGHRRLQRLRKHYRTEDFRAVQLCIGLNSVIFSQSAKLLVNLKMSIIIYAKRQLWTWGSHVIRTIS